MVTVTSGDLSPLVTGLVYCNVVATCQQVYAIARALTTTKPAWQRARLLPTYAEIMLTTGEREKARTVRP